MQIHLSEDLSEENVLPRDAHKNSVNAFKFMLKQPLHFMAKETMFDWDNSLHWRNENQLTCMFFVPTQNVFYTNNMQ